MESIIVISGKQYSGKDTLAKILLEKLAGYKRIGIGDAIKIRYGKEKNLTFEEIEKNKHLYRDDLIKLGNWGRNIDKYYWLKSLSGMNKIIVPDTRMKDEIDFFKSKNAFLVRVESDVEQRKKRGVLVNPNDDTETNLDNYDGWDIVVYNNSDLDNLYTEADKIINLLKK